jgi:hypothetical protein
MNPEQDRTEPVEAAVEPTTYEAPKVESVLTADDLAREIQYAGIST